MDTLEETRPELEAFAVFRSDANILRAHAAEADGLAEIVHDREAMRALQRMASELRRHARRVAK
mgnify:CR=1 FL=1